MPTAKLQVDKALRFYVERLGFQASFRYEDDAGCNAATESNSACNASSSSCSVVSRDALLTIKPAPATRTNASAIWTVTRLVRALNA
jgi:hypothetical protein